MPHSPVSGNLQQPQTGDTQFSGMHTHLQLMKDPADPLCLTTLSHWNQAADLERYRTSELFEGVWRQVKPLFGARTQAFSLESFISVP